MAKGLIARNWKLLAILLGIGLVREALQRQKMIDLQGKVVLITGGSRGLGLALAEEFAREGARLAICSRSENELARARMILSEHGAEVFSLPCDVTVPQQVQAFVQQVTERFGRIDVLVNNAGVISAGPWETLVREDFEEAMNIMYWGIYNTVEAVVPQMKERQSGRIVNITSIGGKVSVPHLLPYSSAKFAAVGFSEGLHAEVAKDGIAVVTVAPGLLRTGSHSNAVIKGENHRTEYTLFTLLDTLPGSSISVRRAARQIVFATKRGSAELIISVPAQLAARIHGTFPGLITDVLALANRFLPRAQNKERYQGKQSETSLSKSFLTILGQKASQRYNETEQ